MEKHFKLLFVINVDWFFFDHRLPIANAARDLGIEVYVAAADTGSGKRVEEHGFHFINLPALERSNGLFGEPTLIRELGKLYRDLSPDLVHHVTIRPVLYGGIAARRAGVPGVVNELTGLGYLYINDTWKTRVARLLLNPFFRYGFRNPGSCLLLQNRDDVELILEHNLAESDQVKTVGGTGVNIDKFYYREEESDQQGDGGYVHIVYTGRMLWDKGIGEMVEAVGRLHQKGLSVILHLYGLPYKTNPQSISEEQLEAWDREDYVTYHGFEKDMVGALHHSNIVCLPSYREGLSKTLLEAASAGRPIVTTDTPGCRDIVEDGENGFLVPVRDVDHLTEKLEILVRDPGMRKRFGRYGREKIEKEFPQNVVTERTIQLYRELAGDYWEGVDQAAIKQDGKS